MYQKTAGPTGQAGGGAQGPTGEAPGGGKKEEEVIDAEYVDVDEKSK